jgi:hypothetical protein
MPRKSLAANATSLILAGSSALYQTPPLVGNATAQRKAGIKKDRGEERKRREGLRRRKTRRKQERAGRRGEGMKALPKSWSRVYTSNRQIEIELNHDDGVAGFCLKIFSGLFATFTLTFTI